MNLKKLKKILKISVFFLFIFHLPAAFSAEDKTMESSSPYEGGNEEESYDPFVDYSEFNQMEEEEEEDINFFLQGRFLSLSFQGGYRFLTQTLGKITQPGFTYGLSISYFFNLQFALKFRIMAGSNILSFISPEDTGVQGSYHMTDFNFNLKYYFDPQTFVRWLSVLNPYVYGGFSQLRRTTILSSDDANQGPFAKEDAFQFNIGGGLEVPIIRKKVFLGIETSYHVVNFSNEQSEIVLKEGAESTGLYPNGDIISALLNIGINF